MHLGQKRPCFKNPGTDPGVFCQPFFQKRGFVGLKGRTAPDDLDANRLDESTDLNADAEDETDDEADSSR